MKTEARELEQGEKTLSLPRTREWPLCQTQKENKRKKLMNRVRKWREKKKRNTRMRRKMENRKQKTKKNRGLQCKET